MRSRFRPEIIAVFCIIVVGGGVAATEHALTSGDSATVPTPLSTLPIPESCASAVRDLPELEPGEDVALNCALNDAEMKIYDQAIISPTPSP